MTPSTSLRRTAYTATALAFALVVLGGIVRITGSGMGCGDDWPRCNGEWFPPLDLPTFIEIFHRWVAVLVSLAVVATAGVAWTKHRPQSRLVWPATVAVALLVTQILLGAVTVKLELPPSVVILHFVNAMLLVTALLVTALRAREAGGDRQPEGAGPGPLLWITALLGFGVVILGAHVANLDAGPACQGFPLCLGGGAGGLLPPPGGGGQALVHWVHRITAYGFTALVLGVAWREFRSSSRGARRTAIIGVALLTATQIAVAAGMVLLTLPAGWRVAHVLIGTAVWLGLVGALHFAASPAHQRPS